MRVIVTRPEPGLSRTMARLGAEGYDAVALPLTRAKSLGDGVKAVQEMHPDVYVATSAAALDAAADNLDLTLPIWTVGPATAQRARKAGFADVRQGPGEGQGLARAIIETEVPDLRLLYLAGRERTAGFEDILKAAGRAIDVVEVYDVEQIDHGADLIANTFTGNPAVMLYSGGAARALADQVLHETAIIAVCMSENVAASLPENWLATCVVAEAPNEDGMLAALARIRNQRR
ncbi:uroporphyrinogen-III synthase [Rhizobium sp. EC-SD404]|uniref:uroporphyrinogen-III synthase n=1 Tax=Rhizobium sp. EC-SD404 TaxID=2038389 RepID=UPI0012545AC3|nr:uroporphyrinogen-III synthase [Rhizobium sp. EC-SD404]VVT00168.1 Uroporphyrinogen-III synthase [Rhizobium sp. EC-SD404]